MVISTTIGLADHRFAAMGAAEDEDALIELDEMDECGLSNRAVKTIHALPEYASSTLYRFLISKKMPRRKLTRGTSFIYSWYDRPNLSIQR